MGRRPGLTTDFHHMVITDSSRSRLNGAGWGQQSPGRSGAWRKQSERYWKQGSTTLYRRFPRGKQRVDSRARRLAREALSCSLVGICKWIRDSVPPQRGDSGD